MSVFVHQDRDRKGKEKVLKALKNKYFQDLVGEGGFEPPKALPADLQSVPFGHSGIPPYSVADCQVELVDGFEPPTC